jgi:dimeric dUTPase (all-alpha-NTP-PPase superfamily)
MNDPIASIDAENIEKNVTESYKSMHKAIKQFVDFESKFSFVKVFFYVFLLTSLNT